METKKCIACGIVKPASDFKPRKNGLHNQCRSCINEKARLWHAMNKNKPEQKERRRLAAEKNREKNRERARAWYWSHPEERKEYVRKYAEKNKEKLAKYFHDYNRKRHLKKYNLTQAEFGAMLLSQNGVCAICKDLSRNSRDLVIDHSHKTDRVRGLLCDRCNTTLGFMEDNPMWLQAASQYLWAHELNKGPQEVVSNGEPASKT